MIIRKWKERGREKMDGNKEGKKRSLYRMPEIVQMR
jgi:hypothetical protein